eukprot:4412336-Amphidinium_carterae.2
MARVKGRFPLINIAPPAAFLDWEPQRTSKIAKYTGLTLSQFSARRQMFYALTITCPSLVLRTTVPRTEVASDLAGPAASLISVDQLDVVSSFCPSSQ